MNAVKKNDFGNEKLHFSYEGKSDELHDHSIKLLGEHKTEQWKIKLRNKYEETNNEMIKCKKLKRSNKITPRAMKLSIY